MGGSALADVLSPLSPRWQRDAVRVLQSRRGIVSAVTIGLLLVAAVTLVSQRSAPAWVAANVPKAHAAATGHSFSAAAFSAAEEAGVQPVEARQALQQVSDSGGSNAAGRSNGGTSGGTSSAGSSHRRSSKASPAAQAAGSASVMAASGNSSSSSDLAANSGDAVNSEEDAAGSIDSQPAAGDSTKGAADGLGEGPDAQAAADEAVADAEEGDPEPGAAAAAADANAGKAGTTGRSKQQLQAESGDTAVGAGSTDSSEADDSSSEKAGSPSIVQTAHGFAEDAATAAGGAAGGSTAAAAQPAEDTEQPPQAAGRKEQQTKQKPRHRRKSRGPIQPALLAAVEAAANSDSAVLLAVSRIALYSSDSDPTNMCSMPPERSSG